MRRQGLPQGYPRCRPRDPHRQVDAEAAVGPLEHAPGQPLVDERALEEEGNDGSAEVSDEPGEIKGGGVNESPLAIETAFHTGAVPTVAASMQPARTARTSGLSSAASTP
jgi:hypothetical protein